MRITIHPKYKDQEEAILQLVKTFYGEGNLVMKGTRNTIKTNFLGSKKISIKFFQKPGIIKSFIYSFLRSTKAKRSFDNANYLLGHSILTPFPVAFIEERFARNRKRTWRCAFAYCFLCPPGNRTECFRYHIRNEQAVR